MATPLVDPTLADTWVDTWLADLRRQGLSAWALERRARLLARATVGSGGTEVIHTVIEFTRWYRERQEENSDKYGDVNHLNSRKGPASARTLK
jgi:hypothetical protein